MSLIYPLIVFYTPFDKNKAVSKQFKSFSEKNRKNYSISNYT